MIKIKAIIDKDKLSFTCSQDVDWYTLQAALPASANGSIRWCSDCNSDATCTGSGSGAFAFRIGAAWACELN